MKKLYTLIALSLLLWNCESFIDIPTPDNQLSKDLVFDDVSTADSALTQVYTDLFQNVLVTGNTSGISFLLAAYTDELELNSSNSYSEFFTNQLHTANSPIASLWNNAYKAIFQLNSIIEGVTNSQGITKTDKQKLLGEAYFTRAYIHYYLQGLFGKVPYVQTTDYQINSKIGKLDTQTFNLFLEKDLEKAYELLEDIAPHALKGRPSKDAVKLLQARLAVNQGKWTQVINYTTDIIMGNYHLEIDMDKVFLKESPEIIWQLLAKAGVNAMEGTTFIFNLVPPPHYMSSNLLNSFETGDLRTTHWVRTLSNGTDSYAHFYKYKENQNTATSKEYSIQFRLAEVYLIRAEAYIKSNQTELGIKDINKIRQRSNLLYLSTTDENQAIEFLKNERRHELFGEQGHRFFDLKRWGLLDQELFVQKPNWQSHHRNWPLPEKELLLNPNLKPQNDDY